MVCTLQAFMTGDIFKQTFILCLNSFLQFSLNFSLNTSPVISSLLCDTQTVILEVGLQVFQLMWYPLYHPDVISSVSPYVISSVSPWLGILCIALVWFPLYHTGVISSVSPLCDIFHINLMWSLLPCVIFYISPMCDNTHHLCMIIFFLFFPVKSYPKF